MPQPVRLGATTSLRESAEATENIFVAIIIGILVG
jgi:hypothetical protein